MATATLAVLDGILKNEYRGPIVELLNQETFLIDQVEKTSANNLGTVNAGRQVIVPVHSSRNRGRGAITDGGTLPGAGNQGYLNAIGTFRYFTQAIELTDAVIEQSKTDEGAFIRALESEMQGAMTDLRKDISRMCYGTGDGVLANISGAGATSATQAVDSGQYIAVGDTVDVLTKSNGTVKGTALTVNSVTFTGAANNATQTNANVVLSSSVTTAAGDAIYVSGDRNNETDGLQNICSTGRTLHNLNSSTYPIWDSNVISAGQANPSEDLFMQLAQRIRLRAGNKGTNIDWFLTTLGVQRRLANTYSSQKRWNDAKVLEIDGGYSAIMVAAGGKPVPVISDVDAPQGTAFAISKDSLAWAELAPCDWLRAPNGEGDGILHLKPGSTAGTWQAIWQGFVKWYAELMCVAPLRNGKLTGFNDDIPIARV